MRTGWGTLACGVVVGAAAGFVCGHVAAWTQASAPPPQRTILADVPPPTRDVERLLPPESEPDGPVFFPQHLHPAPVDAQPVHADAELTGGKERSPALGGHEPAALPEPAEATPLPDDGDRTLRAILEAELSHLTPADRDVWLDVLEGLPPADALGIVRLWKRFGSGPGLADESHHANSLPESMAPSILVPTPNSPIPFSEPGPLARSTRTNLREARELVMHNLLSAETFGFRRFDPFLAIPSETSSLATPEVAAGAGTISPPPTLQMIHSRIDHSAGEIVETSSPLDLAIAGDGFFVVTNPEEGEFFTRCGRFSRDEEGRLALRTSRGELPVSPEIRIPNDCAAMTVAPDGEVTIRRDGGPPEKIGILTVAMFVAPAQLAQRNDALLSVTDRSGAPQLGRPNDGLRGGIVQKRLECSNVDIAEETELLRRIDEWLALIQGEQGQERR